MAANGNWKINDQTHQSQEAAVRATTLPPPDDLESAIIANLQPQQGYTALVRGVNGATGVGLFEAYDLNPDAGSRLANISTRGFVETGDNIMIGGFILVGSTNGNRVIIRAIGPSLNINGVPLPGRLADPKIELRDSEGTLVAANNNWKVHNQSGQSQEAEVRATTLPPVHDLEAAILITLPAGAYTALVSGRGGQTGVALVEVYTCSSGARLIRGRKLARKDRLPQQMGGDGLGEAIGEVRFGQEDVVFLALEIGSE